MDQLAAKVGMSPLDFRILNCLKEGQTTATGQAVNEGTGIEATLQRIKQYMTDNTMDWTTT